jgi:hypothetical protein
MKKRSVYRPKPVIMPLNIKRLEMLELPGHIALVALDKPWLTKCHLADLGAHVAITGCVAHELGDEKMQELAQRAADLLGDLSTPPLQVDELRSVVGITLQWLSQQSNSVIGRKTLELFKM